jgi:tRNA pseudouridine38-40 synthase
MKGIETQAAVAPDSYLAPMPRYALKIEYHGAPFAGWQRQADQPSVQGAVEAALAKLEPDIPYHRRRRAHRCGRACAGTGGALRPGKDWDPFRLSEALNYHLKPAPVAMVACAHVADGWHARFSACERRYLFRLVMRRAPLTHDAGQVWQVPHGSIRRDAGRRRRT